VESYRPFLFGVISDIEFPRGGELHRDAGFELARMIRAKVPDAPIVLHSSRPEYKFPAQAEGFTFLRKGSDTLLTDLRELFTEQNQVLIGDFQSGTFKATPDFFLRLGGGSLGGKARGLAFVRYLLHKFRLTKRFEGVRITVPPTLVIATKYFDQFLRDNNLLS